MSKILKKKKKTRFWCRTCQLFTIFDGGLRLGCRTGQHLFVGDGVFSRSLAVASSRLHRVG